ncbi:MAG: hypothetical protein RLZZ111_1915 [Planctomycetota bacterium]|jgi:hypothetical protein
MPFRLPRAFVFVMAVTAAFAGASVHRAAAAPAPTPAEIDRDWSATIEDLVRRAEAGGHEAVVTAIRGWDLPAEEGRQFVLAIPADPRDEKVPDGVETPAARGLWEELLAARKRRAAATFAVARELADDGDASPPRTGESIRLVYRALRDDPDNERAREAAGWVRRDGRWVWPEMARRLDKGEEFAAEFGWLPRGRLARYRAGERYDQGRWIKPGDTGTAPRRPRDLKTAAKLASDHWLVSYTGDIDAAARLATELEQAHTAWVQAFGGFQHEPAEWRQRMLGRGRTRPLDPFAVTLASDRDAYVAALEPLEPTIARTLGIYWTPTRTAWFFEGAGQETTTVRHEATHQLFAETRKTSPLAGERCGFWAIEAAACYLESLEPTTFGWTLGGREAGRAPAARERLLDDGFHVPLEGLCRLGRRALQADPRLPQIYSEISGLADFFMNGERGRYRDAFVEYLVRIYTGTVDPDTLAKLCGTSYASLDDAYRRHMAR